MSVIVAGTFRIPPDSLDAFRPHLRAVIAATREEAGCLVYSYGIDLDDPGLIHVFEHWADQSRLDAHFQTSHMAAWRQAREALGFYDRRLTVFEVAGEREA